MDEDLALAMKAEVLTICDAIDDVVMPGHALARVTVALTTLQQLIGEACPAVRYSPELFPDTYQRVADKAMARYWLGRARAALAAAGDPDPEATIMFVGAETACGYAEGEAWAAAVIDGPDETHRAFFG